MQNETFEIMIINELKINFTWNAFDLVMNRYIRTRLFSIRGILMKETCRAKIFIRTDMIKKFFYVTNL